MTISLLSKASGNPNLDLVFDLYVQGTSPPPTGLLDDSGIDICTRYNPIVYGTQALATGLLTKQTGNADINTLFAAKGTSNNPLSINGGTYTITVTRSGSGGSQAQIIFAISGTTWTLYPYGTGGTYTPSGSYASGSLPPNSSTVEFSLSSQSGSTVNELGSPVNTVIAISSNPYIGTYTTASGTIGTANGQINVTITIRNASGSVISTTTYTAVMIIQL